MDPRPLEPGLCGLVSTWERQPHAGYTQQFGLYNFHSHQCSWELHVYSWVWGGESSELDRVVGLQGGLGLPLTDPCWQDALGGIKVLYEGQTWWTGNVRYFKVHLLKKLKWNDGGPDLSLQARLKQAGLCSICHKTSRCWEGLQV